MGPTQSDLVRSKLGSMNTPIEKGLLWWVDNESSINIYTNPWLLNGEGKVATTPNPNNHKVYEVSELMEFELGDWKVSLIENLFRERDARFTL